MRVQQASPQHRHWLKERLGGAKFADDFKAIEAVDETGKIRGMAGYDQWTRASVTGHMAVTDPSGLKALLKPMFEYPFLQAGRSVLRLSIPSHSVRYRRIALGLGFQQTHRVRDGYDVNDDMVLYEMRRDDCRWLGRVS